jgi:uncharacterized protein (TIGR03663 family)
MSDRVLRSLPLALIALLGLALRIYHIADRPMHADEANQGVKTGELLEHGNYAFDPLDHHGPVLYYAALPLAWFRGERTLSNLSESTLRLVPALAGTVAILLLACLSAPLGRWPALAAATFLATCPPAVYYSRYFIQETLLLTFTLGAFVSFRHWWRSGALTWSVATGVCGGLAIATKASAPVFLIVGLGAFLTTRPVRAQSIRPWRDFMIPATFAIIIAATFYSSFGSHWSGLVDAVKVYGLAAKRVTRLSGHEKSWWYYFRLFGWHHEGGLLWQQLGFSALALGGFLLAIVGRAPRIAKDDLAQKTETARWAAIYTAIIALLLAAIPYKTPWHAIHFVPGMALLSAYALSAIPSRILATLLATVVVALQFSQVNLAVFLRPADPRNPYAYVHSSPDVFKFRPLVEAAQVRHREGIVRVIGSEYWPLPWYLRGVNHIGYWSSAPSDCDGALVIASTQEASVVRARLHGTYRETLLGLRPDVVCVVFSAQ